MGEWHGKLKGSYLGALQRTYRGTFKELPAVQPVRRPFIRSNVDEVATKIYFAVGRSTRASERILLRCCDGSGAGWHASFCLIHRTNKVWLAPRCLPRDFATRCAHGYGTIVVKQSAYSRPSIVVDSEQKASTDGACRLIQHWSQLLAHDW